jgi:hypothetical protein
MYESMQTLLLIRAAAGTLEQKADASRGDGPIKVPQYFNAPSVKSHRRSIRCASG